MQIFQIIMFQLQHLCGNSNVKIIEFNQMELILKITMKSKIHLQGIMERFNDLPVTPFLACSALGLHTCTNV